TAKHAAAPIHAVFTVDPTVASPSVSISSWRNTRRAGVRESGAMGTAWISLLRQRTAPACRPAARGRPITFVRHLRWLRVLAAIMGVTMIAAVVHGLTLPLVALRFDRWGFDAELVGLNAAAGTCGILLVGPFLPAVIARVGLSRVVAAAILLATSAVAAMA